MGKVGEGMVLRGSIGLRENVSVLEILSVGAHLEMLLEGFFALDGRDGGVFDVGVCFLCRHVGWVYDCSRVNVCQNSCLLSTVIDSSCLRCIIKPRQVVLAAIAGLSTGPRLPRYRRSIFGAFFWVEPYNRSRMTNPLVAFADGSAI